MISHMLPYLMRSGSTADRARPTCARARGLVAAGLIALAVTSVACGDSGSKETDSGTSDTDDGTLDQIALAYTPSESSVLSGTLAIATDAPTSVVSVVVEPLDGAPTWEVPASGIASAPDGRSHEVMILGLKEARAYTFTATVRHDEGEGQPERSAELIHLAHVEVPDDHHELGGAGAIRALGAGSGAHERDGAQVLRQDSADGVDGGPQQAAGALWEVLGGLGHGQSLATRRRASSRSVVGRRAPHRLCSWR